MGSRSACPLAINVGTEFMPGNTCGSFCLEDVLRRQLPLLGHPFLNALRRHANQAREGRLATRSIDCQSQSYNG